MARRPVFINSQTDSEGRKLGICRHLKGSSIAIGFWTRKSEDSGHDVCESFSSDSESGHLTPAPDFDILTTNAEHDLPLKWIPKRESDDSLAVGCVIGATIGPQRRPVALCRCEWKKGINETMWLLGQYTDGKCHPPKLESHTPCTNHQILVCGQRNFEEEPESVAAPRATTKWQALSIAVYIGLLISGIIIIALIFVALQRYRMSKHERQPLRPKSMVAKHEEEYAEAVFHDGEYIEINSYRY